jgi:hypothetical protein
MVITGALVLALVSCRRGRPGEVVDLDGHRVDPLAGSAMASATVLVFASASCPLSNRYAPELGRLHRRFAPRGVAFYLVYTDPDEPVAALKEHARAHQYPFPTLRDPRHELVKQSGVAVTPEAAVFLPGARLAYHGRIDDRLVDFGKERASPTRTDLADALEAVLTGRPVSAAVTPALGCTISGAGH